MRKDYSCLFERFFYLLEDKVSKEIGIVVFDELEKARSHVLVEQMSKYFLETERGRMRSGRILPEPLFAHSDLTSALQVADLIAYVTNWGVEITNRITPARSELEEFGQMVCKLRYRATREKHGNPDFNVWSFAVIDDLRPRTER